ncbi:hypothetical protein QVD17_11331 [Tagetes erecta]|uniref:MLO-like protein n=1 Tax=Tagetes erecta TaxID=13708 RepID=A0AAD8KX42_TARER|nr:hypothetical protein QVD17_11331 [Tagetes erecta]
MVATHTLQNTPTWAVATVCFVFIFLGLVIEHLFHIASRVFNYHPFYSNWLKERRKIALFEAVEKLKSVLMLLGLMSLILVTTQKSIAKICIPNKVAYSMLPCHKISKETLLTTQAYEVHYTTSPWFEPHGPEHRRLASVSATSNSTGYCASKGMTSFISEDGLNQLNTFICVLAIMQIVYSVVTMALGGAKMRSWKAWEQETQTTEYLVANDPNRFRFTRQTTFGRRHMHDPINATILLWIKCFFRQFFHSVAKVDYFTLRHGFISFLTLSRVSELSDLHHNDKHS